MSFDCAEVANVLQSSSRPVSLWPHLLEARYQFTISVFGTIVVDILMEGLPKLNWNLVAQFPQGLVELRRVDNFGISGDGAGRGWLETVVVV
jgi:hypothetical protein